MRILMSRNKAVSCEMLSAEWKLIYNENVFPFIFAYAFIFGFPSFTLGDDVGWTVEQSIYSILPLFDQTPATFKVYFICHQAGLCRHRKTVFVERIFSMAQVTRQKIFIKFLKF